MVSTAAVTLVANPDWVERLGEAADSWAEIAREIKVGLLRERARLKFYFAAVKFNRIIVEFISGFDSTLADAQTQWGLAAPPEDEKSRAIIEKGLENLRRLYRIVHGIHQLAVLAGFRKKKLTQGQVELLGESADRILDYIAWIEDATSLDFMVHATESYAAGLLEHGSGETVSLF